MAKMTEKQAINAEEIEWVSTFSNDYNSENSLEKLKRKCKESPLVPIGLVATIGALSFGLYNFYHGRNMMQQYSMRARVGFQAFTLAAITYSMYNEGKKRIQEKEKEKETAKAKAKS